MNPWDSYARKWLESPSEVHIQDSNASDDPRFLGTIGDEWGTKASVAAVVEEFLLPFVNPRSAVLDLGCGGGRVSRALRPHVGELVGVDPSMQMLTAGARLAPGATTGLVRISGRPAELPLRPSSFDLIYSFDVMVHFESRLIFRYILACRELLRAGGRLVLHVATTDTVVGLECFRRSSLEGQTAVGFGALSFQSRILMEHMGRMADLPILLVSAASAGHFYCQRDLIVVYGKQGSED